MKCLNIWLHDFTEPDSSVIEIILYSNESKVGEKFPNKIRG